MKRKREKKEASSDFNKKLLSFDCDFIRLSTKIYFAVIIKYCEKLKIQ